MFPLFLGCFQKVQTKNLDILRKAVVGRSPSTPLVTVSNHKSCIDDPVIWGMILHDLQIMLLMRNYVLF